MLESLALCLLVYGLVNWLFPSDRKNYEGCGCVWTTLDGGMGRDIGKTVQCPKCGPVFRKLIKDNTPTTIKSED